MKRVLVQVDEKQWAAMRSRALELGKPVPEVVAWAFRQYLSGRAEASEDEAVTSPVTRGEPTTTGRPTAAELAALINAVKPGSVTTGRVLDPTRGIRREAGESGSQMRPDDEDDFHTF